MIKKLYDNNDIMLFHGDVIDALEYMQTLDIAINGCVTSPPYAEQRKDLYGGIPEVDYPQWTVDWMTALRPMFSDESSCLINIRENMKNGQITDYVLRTRLALRDDKWNETEELIWIKPDSPPVGNMKLPRRSWERILWWSKTAKPYVDAKANGQDSNRLGMPKSQTGKGYNQWGGSYDDTDDSNKPDFKFKGYDDTKDNKKPDFKFKSGRSRCKDYVEIPVSDNESHGHPAVYPIALAEWMIKLISKEGDTIIDPFNGSGSTAIACIKTKRKYIGIDYLEKFLDTTVERIDQYHKDEADKKVNDIWQ